MAALLNDFRIKWLLWKRLTASTVFKYVGYKLDGRCFFSVFVGEISCESDLHIDRIVEGAS